MGPAKVTTQPKEKRGQNFDEVSLGYSKRLTSDEAKRCPQCADPVCMKGCPLGINIPGFIRLLREGNVAGAYEIIREQNCLPSICGRICSAPCELACVLNDEKAPIGIRALERYASDFGKPRAPRREGLTLKGKKIAIIGSGPAGLAAASALARKGFAVKIFESFAKAGGVLRYGIPEFRIPRRVLDAEINEIRALGVEIETNFYGGQTASLEDLQREGFQAILLATGAGMPQFMDIPGTHLGGVYYGEEFLMRVNNSLNGKSGRPKPEFFVGSNVVVIGSGNTALDCARSALRLGKKVKMIFRRTESEMRVREDEREFTKEEGVALEPLVRPLEILADQNYFVEGIKCVRMDYADPSGKDQWELMAVPGSEYIEKCETVVIAIGHKPNTLLARMTPKLKLNEDGTLKLNDLNGMTSLPGVFAAGNVVSNAGPVVMAIAAGKKAAENIYKYLKDN